MSVLFPLQTAAPTSPEHLVVTPMLVALVAAVGTLLLRQQPIAQAVASLAGGLGFAASVAGLAWSVVLAPDAPGVATYQVADWPAPYGITLVADGLSAFTLAMAATIGVASLVFSLQYVPVYDQRTFYHPLFHFLLLGISGAFLTGDLFNLFVWFEVLLMASYVFVAFYGNAKHTRAALWYVALNVVGSAIFLLAIGGLYATTGTLNMADMAQRLADPASHDVAVGPTVGLLGLLVAVFGLKAGLVPFQFWVPAAYCAAPPPITALLAGATKKVGIYAIVRLSFTVFAGASVEVRLPGIAGGSPLAFVGPVLLAMAVGSILVGGIGAVNRDSIEGVLAYSSIGQVGFIAIAIAIAAATTSPELRHLAILAALVYALNHTLAKGMLFLAAGAVRSATGTSQLDELGGLASRSPALSGAFFVGALALVGIPPLSGFFGKFLVFDAAARAGDAAVIAVLLGGSVLTIAYTTRTWNRGFWGPRSVAVEDATVDPVQVAVLVCLALAILAVGVGFDPIYQFADAAAEAALDREAYVEAVAPNGGDSPHAVADVVAPTDVDAVESARGENT